MRAKVDVPRQEDDVVVGVRHALAKQARSGEACSGGGGGGGGEFRRRRVGRERRVGGELARGELRGLPVP